MKINCMPVLRESALKKLRWRGFLLFYQPKKRAEMIHVNARRKLLN